MKHLILIGDGMADYPLEDQGGRTPLDIARTPAMDAAVQHGLIGLFRPIPEGLPPGSDIGNLSLFGYNPRETFTGRAPLEAANQGIHLSEDQVAFRCNLVTLRDGLMEDFTSGHIETEEARPLVAALNEALGALFGASFHTGVSYRHLAIMPCRDAALDYYQRLGTTPPHDITGRPFDGYLPEGPGQDIVRDLMVRSRSVLEDHPVNAARIAAGKRPATSAWLWGQGRAPRLEPYPERFGIHGAVISAVDLVNGIGVCAGLEVVKVPGATGYLDTNYKGKVAAALEALDRLDFVYVHVEAPDETSHEGRLDLKVQAIEDFDANVVAPCLEFVLNRTDCRLLIAPDHVTSLASRTHAPGAVPFALCGTGVIPDASCAYTERAALETGLLLPEGCVLTPHCIANNRVSRDSLAAAALS